MRPQLLHLSGPLRGRTVTYDDHHLVVGSASGADLVLDDPAVAGRHAVIDYQEQDCAFVLRALDGRTFVNRNEVEEVMLQDDDLIEWGVDGPRSRFRVYVPPGRVCKPVRRMLQDAHEVGRSSGPVVAATGLVHDLLTRASLQLKIGFPLLVLGVALPLAWVAGWLGSRPAVSSQKRADQVTLAELEALRAEMQRQAKELERLREASAVLRRVQQHWSRGVCLIHGIAALRLPDGRPVPGPDGRPLRLEYTGSGFLAAADGSVLTNRHVVTPWETEPRLAQWLQHGATPEFLRLTATFPGRLPVQVPPDSIRRRHDDLDVAAFSLPQEAVAGVPVLPLHQGSLDELPDQRAIVVGYPTGLAALLAKADPQVVAELRQAAADMTAVIDRLAADDRISPLITQGVLGNVQEQMLVYDAPTTHGGSGGPVFGGNGMVVAVNFAILRDFTGANFGVPIRYGRELLPD